MRKGNALGSIGRSESRKKPEGIDTLSLALIIFCAVAMLGI